VIVWYTNPRFTYQSSSRMFCVHALWCTDWAQEFNIRRSTRWRSDGVIRVWT